MADTIQEKNIENYPKPVSKECTLTILEQMEKSICKIYTKGGTNGTGFFCYIPYETNKIPVFITNYHIIGENFIKNNDNILITLNDDKEQQKILLNKNNILYTNKEYDTTIIELNKSIINKPFNFMEFDEKLFFENSESLYNKTSNYIIQYPNNKLHVSFGIIQYIDKFNIYHFCTTEKGSSGSPIMNLSNNKIIGIHKGSSENLKINKGTLLKEPINEFLDQYKNRENKNAMGFTDCFKNSKIIKGKEDSVFIISSLQKKIKIKNIELLYCSSLDGKSCSDFKKKCNNKGATLTVVKSNNNEIFGGFTKCNWTNEECKFGQDKDAFLYSITNKKIFEIVKPEKAIINYDEGYAFACFGNTDDWNGLYFYARDNNIEGYNNPKNLTDIYNIPDSKELCSDFFFNVIEMEVYQIK